MDIPSVRHLYRYKLDNAWTFCPQKSYCLLGGADIQYVQNVVINVIGKELQEQALQKTRHFGSSRMGQEFSKEQSLLREGRAWSSWSCQHLICVEETELTMETQGDLRRKEKSKRVQSPGGQER